METLAPREQWVRFLNHITDEELESFISHTAKRWKVSPITLPQAGLGILKVSETAFNEDFYLGEFPVATCHVSINTDRGENAQGATWIMSDNQQRAQNLAICDGILDSKLSGWDTLVQWIKEGMELCQNTDLERKAILAETRVNFSLLDDAGEDDA